MGLAEVDLGQELREQEFCTGRAEELQGLGDELPVREVWVLRVVAPCGT